MYVRGKIGESVLSIQPKLSSPILESNMNNAACQVTGYGDDDITALGRHGNETNKKNRCWVVDRNACVGWMNE